MISYVTDQAIIRFLTLQLPLLLNASSNKHIVFEIIALVEKKPPKSSERLEKKLCVQLVKQSSKLVEKTRKENQELD